MMSLSPVAGGDAAAASGLGDSDSINLSDERRRSVPRRMAAVEAEKRQRLFLHFCHRLCSCP